MKANAPLGVTNTQILKMLAMMRRYSIRMAIAGYPVILLVADDALVAFIKRRIHSIAGI